MILRFLVAFFAFDAALSATTMASAAVVKDGEKYSVDFGKSRICWITPHELRDAADCEGLTPDNVPVPPDDKARVVAMGLVRLEQPGEAADLALVMVMHVAMPFVTEADDKSAKDFVQGAEKAVAKELPPGAHMRPGSSARVVKPGKHPLIRAVLDADGIADTADEALMQHQLHVAVLATDGLYSVTWMMRSKDARAVEAIADSTSASITIPNPAMSNEQFGKTIGLAVGGVLGAGLLLIGAVIVIVVATSKKKPQAPYAYPYPYSGYPSSAPPPAWHPSSVAPVIPPPPRNPAWWDQPR